MRKSELLEQLKSLESETLDKLTEVFEACESDDKQSVSTASLLAGVGSMFQSTISDLEEQIKAEGESLSSDDLEDIANLAQEYDESGDEDLQRLASVFDTVLATFGDASKKKASDEDDAKLRAELREKTREKLYKEPKEWLDKNIKAEQSRKLVEQTIKQYRPLEAPLHARHCPDHPGCMMTRLANDIYQCSMDKKIYNYHEGYTTMKGNKVPGGGVDLQNNSIYDRQPASLVFDSRESKLHNR